MNKLDILNLEWPNSDRDLHIVTPVLEYLKLKYNLRCKTLSIFNGYYYVLKYKPKLILISNYVGADTNHKLIKNIRLLNIGGGIKIVTLISEGNVSDLNPISYLWGWNLDKKLYIDKMILWSTRSKNHFLNAYPEFEEKMAVSGATGFDRYKLFKFINKTDFLNKYKLKYKKVIGIGSFVFDAFFDKLLEQTVKLGNYQKENIELFQQDRFKLHEIYKKLIEKNKDILFILRYHPGTINFEKNEFYGLEQYENVFISNSFTNTDIKITDIINISDLWIAYESTTVMEAWLLGKQTFLINPTKSDFVRENVYKGSPIAKTEEESQRFIDEFFSTNTIRSFENLENTRKQVIKDIIEHCDGKNYQRAAEEIIKIIPMECREIKFGFRIYIEAAKQICKLFLSKTIFKNRWPDLKYKSNFAKKYQDMYSKVIRF